MKCPFCGYENPYLTLTCSRCFAYIYPEEEEAARLSPKEDHRKYNKMALISLILGITGIIVFYCYPAGFINSIAAIITGIIGRNKINEDKEKQKGENLAWGGIICGIIALLGSIILAILDYIWKITSLYHV